MKVPRSRRFFITLAAAALVVVLLANAHLVYVASASQPECVAHASTDGTKRAPGVFRAARSSC